MHGPGEMDGGGACLQNRQFSCYSSFGRNHGKQITSKGIYEITVDGCHEATDEAHLSDFPAPNN